MLKITTQCFRRGSNLQPLDLWPSTLPMQGCAPQLESTFCRYMYDACPTQYAPDLRASRLCMQGTQYAPRESILCMEHFVALQCA